jgi:hypothetical protein
MKKNQYTLAGWSAITSFVVGCPLVIIGFVYDILIQLHQEFMPAFYLIVVLLTLLQLVCSIYAFYQFKKLLNERYQFHQVDMLMIIIIIGSILITAVILFFRAVPVIPVKFIGLAAIIAVGIPLSILGIVFSVKLLHLNHSLHGLLKPLAFTYIAACCCFLTVILSSVGLLIAAAFDLLLGIAFLRGEEKEPDPEFV